MGGSPYDAAHLHAIMAGDGHPYAVLTPIRKRLLFALYHNLSLSELAARFGMSVGEIEAELTPLVAAHLAMKPAEEYVPAFFIANATEVKRVAQHAHDTGQRLAEQLSSRWDEFELSYRQLKVGQHRGFKESAFLLVGDRILDIGLLDILAQDGTLMPPAPARPSPADPTARYYFWMIEGEHDQLGRYGQRAISLPWENWSLLTFGEYQHRGVPNKERDKVESQARDAENAAQAGSPKAMAALLNVALVDQEDAQSWSEVAQFSAKGLLSIYKSRQDSLRQLYASLRASAYARDGFGEFFCWYHHVAYADAIDELAREGRLSLPEQHFTAALWYEEPGTNGF